MTEKESLSLSLSLDFYNSWLHARCNVKTNYQFTNISSVDRLSNYNSELGGILQFSSYICRSFFCLLIIVSNVPCNLIRQYILQLMQVNGL